jgi:hypothetical protein
MERGHQIRQPGLGRCGGQVLPAEILIHGGQDRPPDVAERLGDVGGAACMRSGNLSFVCH